MFFRSVPHYRHRQWISWNKHYSGTVAGSVDFNGYRVVKVFGHRFKIHRLIWKLVHGVDPVCIDHINHITDDNRLSNLRNIEVRHHLFNLSPQKRSRSGVRGVLWYKERGKWGATIAFSGEKIFLGLHDRLEDAVRAREEAEKLYHRIPIIS